MYTVYVLKSTVAAKSYAGSTPNLERRLKEHNTGQSTYTKRYLPWRLVYVEKFDKLEEARKREKWFKTTTGRRFMKKIFENK